MNEYEQTIHIEDPALATMREDANQMLKKLIRKMIDKDSLEGKLTIGIEIKLEKDMVENNDPTIEGDQRPSYTPSFSHKIGTVLQLKDEMKGQMKCDDMELVWDDTLNDFVMRPVTGRPQKTIFDAEYTEVYQDDEDDEEAMIEGPTVPLIEAGSNPMPAPESAETIPFADDDYGYEEPEE